MKLRRSNRSISNDDAEKAEVSKSDAVSLKSSKSGRSKRSFRLKKKEPQEEEDAKSASSGWWNGESDADAKSEYSSSTAYSWREKAVAQRKIQYEHFGDFPKEVLALSMSPKPVIQNPTHVLIKVEVRHYSTVLQENDLLLTFAHTLSSYTFIGIYRYAQ